jgi:hypothetical protein
MDSFYISVNSDASASVHFDNRPEYFTNILPKRIELPGTWGVALLDISYPMTFHNVGQDNGYVWIGDGRNLLRRACLPQGLYHESKEVLNWLTQEFGEKFIFTVVDGKFSCKPKKGTTNSLKFCTKLAWQLGFDKSALLTDNEIRAPRKINLDLGIESQLCVLSNLVFPYYVGDKALPMLRSFNVNLKNYLYGSSGCAVFPNPAYVPVAVKSLSDIHITIKDMKGRTVACKDGTLSMLLHFKRTE